MRIIVLLIMIFGFVFGDEFATASKVCEATNNIKATKNSGNILTANGVKYKILDRKIDSLYIQIPSANPSGRWVKKECFLTSGTIPHAVTKKPIVPTSEQPLAKQSLLSLSWHDGFCETHRNQSECKRGLFDNKEYSFVLHGLWPQPKNLAYCGVDKKIVGMDKNKQWKSMPDIGLSTASINDLTVVMPAVQSSLQNHEWYKHGTCSGMNSTQYFQKASGYVTQFNSSKVAQYINNNRGKIVTLNNIKSLMNSSFGVNSGEKIDMVCNNGILSEIRLNLGGNDSSLAKALVSGAKTRSSCQKAIVDEAGWR